MLTHLVRNLLCVFMGTMMALILGTPSFAADADMERLAAISTIPEDQIQALNKYWEDSPNLGIFVIGDEIGNLTADFQKLYLAEGGAAVAKRILENYGGDKASAEMPAAALALLAEAGYGSKRSMLDKNLFKSKKKDPAKLQKSASSVVEALLAANTPQARLAAAEFMLQLQSEGIVCLHNMSGNGGRRTDLLPPEVTALAAPLLKDTDPFVQALAEWSISVAVCNANDQTRAKAFPTPDADGPEWFKDYMAVPAEMHLPYDYVRQAATLGMHRRASDLAKLAKDVNRRTHERATWAKQEGGDSASIDQALTTMDSALQALEQAAASGDQNPPAFHEKYLTWRKSVRDAVLQGPDIDFDSLVYIKRWNAKSHLQPGVHSASQFPDGGDIFVQKGLQPDAPATALVQENIRGGFGDDLDLWYDGDRIVFSWKTGPTKKLFEIGLDGQNFRQITDGPFDDVDPCYLPDGEVVFGSTRGNVGIMCHGSSGLGSIPPTGASGTFSGLHSNIYRTWDGFQRVERLSYCKDDDAYPHVLNDGRVVWMRWDYQERGVNEIFSLWVMYPDGTGSDGLHKVHIPAKTTIQALRDTRPIEGGSLLISAGGGHYNYSEGAVVIGDPSMGINNPDSLWNVTPYASPVLFGWGGLAPSKEGGVPYLGGYYAKPFGLSAKSYLVSASYDQPQSNNFQVFYIDAWGNKELLQRDKLFETVAVMPVKARKKPPVLPNRTDDTKTYATLYLEDVYADLPGIEKGGVKYIRVMQMMHWIKEAGENGIQYHPLANASECFAFGTGGPVRTIGTVPVYEDGSAYFEVPSDADLYFQALDENFRSVRRMRTHVEFQPGENRGCVGCHETKSLVISSQLKNNALALSHNPSRPTPPPWGDTTLLDYEKHIQPIFNAKCVKCHAGKPDQNWLDLTDKRDQFGFMQGYRSLYGLKPDDPTAHAYWGVTGAIDRKKIKLPRSHDHPWWKAMFEGIIVRSDESGGRVTEVNQYGAVKHPLAKKLVENEKHNKMLSETEMQTIMNFFDAQAPYFSVYRQKVRKDLIQVKVDPYPPFEKSREPKIHHGEDVTPKL
ncbi:MAG: hypothetical protein ACOCVT_01230 [bacterium]